ncbi:MAG: diguanylate cyclase [Azoarcus sp.]|jgi:diguanylate cyclase (GGDEF)-like protein/PAS domain S-box-containing protein|nr:diguanylate cyclase [Azoarcus sp.]
MNKPFRYLTADIAFGVVLVLCLALAVLAITYRSSAEIRQQSEIHSSIAERNAASLIRDIGNLFQDVDFKLTALLNTPPDRRMRPEILRHVLDNAPYLRSISLIDPQGKILASTTSANVGHVLDSKTWLFQTAISDDLLSIGPTYAGQDFADSTPLTDNGKTTPDLGFIPVARRREGGGEQKAVVATIDLAYLLRQTIDTLEPPGARIALLRADGLRLYDTGPPDAGLSVIEHQIGKQWHDGETNAIQELQAIDDRQWLIVHRLHQKLPLGIIWAADRDSLTAASRSPVRRNNLTVMLLIAAGMVCVLFGYVFLRLASRHERERRLETEAQRSLLEGTFNACTCAIVITRPDGVIEWANPAYTALTGYSAVESIGHTPGELCKSGMQNSSFYAQMWQTITNGRIWRGELVNRRKDDSLYDEILTISPAPDSNGVIQHFIATKEDFTEYKAAREELEVTHSHLNSVVENFPGALIMEDTKGRIILLNQSVFELLGLPGTNDYVLGHPIHPLMVFSSHVAEASQTFLERIEELRAAARPDYGEEIRFKDGRWVERDFVPIRLHDDLIGFLYIYRDISQRKRHARELWQLATSDPLTGIPNRRTFFEHIDREHTRLSRYPGEAAILMIDIDYFKQINDSYGHAAGDAMLCHIVRQVRKLLRESDILARLGGEEFAVLLPQASREGALGLAERVRKTLEDNPLIYNDTPVHVTASVGVTIMTAQDLNTDQTLSRADHALYEAKRKGRNQVVANC